MTSDILNIDAELEDRHNKTVREEVQQHRTARCSARQGMSSIEQCDVVHNEK